MAGLVDLRSDTVTRPTSAMRAAMAEAEVGDDGFGEDPTVRALEEHYADLVGKAAAVFVPSGVMANQIALRVHTRPGDVVLAGARQHVVLYELGAAAANASIQFHTLDDTGGMLSAESVAHAMALSSYHQPAITLLCLENTHMPAGGAVWDLAQLNEVADAASGLNIHLDGARLFNASVASGHPASAFAARADSVMSCLSKGLCAPVGSVLAGSVAFIEEARIERKRLGGSMRQAGVLAAAGLLGLRTMVDRLSDDHHRARKLANVIAECFGPSALDPRSVETNLVCFETDDEVGVIRHLLSHGVLVDTIAPRVVRLVTHHDIDDAGLDQAIAAIRSYGAVSS